MTREKPERLLKAQAPGEEKLPCSSFYYYYFYKLWRIYHQVKFG
ncbi:MAG TPA: hypothetical protein V6D31_04565 [Candidatus Sericytochromatia bacterium]